MAAQLEAKVSDSEFLIIFKPDPIPIPKDPKPKPKPKP
jgi:hypothetical protein